MGDSGPADLIAVLYVVESSVVLGSEWSHINTEYLTPMLKRLQETHSNYQFRLGLVTYGPSDAFPSPLVAKHFFGPPHVLTKVLQEDPEAVGIGQTTNGGSAGLCALEGMVAAIELFDMLKSYTKTATNSPAAAKSLTCYLVHVAASPADDSQRPQWNTLPHLDAVTWDSLAPELKNRNIKFNLISLKQIPQFQELQAAISGADAQQPWFNVRKSHTLHLSGFPAPAKSPVKRPTEVPPVDAGPDSKRQRTSRISSESPSKPSPASPAVLPVSTPKQTPPQLNPPPQPPAPQDPARPKVPAVMSSAAQFTTLVQRLKLLEQETESIKTQITNAQSAGQTQTLENLRKEHTLKLQLAHKLKAVIASQWEAIQKTRQFTGQAPKQQTPSDSASTSSPAIAPAVNPPSNETPNLSQDAQSQGKSTQPPSQDSPSLLSFMHNRPGGNGQTGPSAVAQMPPDVAEQMKKLLNNQGIRPQSLTGPSPSTSVAPSAPPAPVTQAAQTTPQPANKIPQWWQGLINWTAMLSSPPMPAQFRFTAAIAGMGDMKMETWPKHLNLHVTQHQIVGNADFQTWARRTNGVLVQLKPVTPPGMDPKINEPPFQALVKILSERRVYATANWMTPSGSETSNLILFVVPGNGLIGAVFPLAGFSQPPHAETPKHQMADLMQRLQQVDPARRPHVLAQMERIRKHQVQTQQFSQAQLLQELSKVIAGAINQQNHTMQGMVSNGATGGIGAVNPEMMQSFMQRHDASGLQGMKPP